MRYCLSLCFVLLTVSHLWAQKVEVIKFNQLEKYFSSDSDTLYVINFWATWCKPCVAELPHFEKLAQAYKSKKVAVVLVSMDFKSKLNDRVVPFVKEKKLSPKVVLLDEPDYNAWISKVAPEWSGALPATLFVQHARNIRSFYEKGFEYPELESLTEKFLPSK